MKPINFKFCTPFKIFYTEMGGFSNIRKPVFDFSPLYPRKNSLRRKLKVCPLVTQIK